jgi:hypothetical protein
MIESEILDVPQRRFYVLVSKKKQVYEAILQIKKIKAPGLDGFPAEFYQKNWKVIKKDLMEMFFAFKKERYLYFI